MKMKSHFSHSEVLML